jgi:hypothetical protein
LSPNKIYGSFKLVIKGQQEGKGFATNDADTCQMIEGHLELENTQYYYSIKFGPAGSCVSKQLHLVSPLESGKNHNSNFGKTFSNNILDSSTFTLMDFSDNRSCCDHFHNSINLLGFQPNQIFVFSMAI